MQKGEMDFFLFASARNSPNGNELINTSDHFLFNDLYAYEFKWKS